MDRTNLIPFMLSLWIILGLGACASPTKEVRPTEMQPTAEASVAETPISVTTSDEPPVQVSEAKPQSAEKHPKKVTRKSALKPSRRVRSSESIAEDEPAKHADVIRFSCIVRLPDDETDHPELCRNFRIIIVDEDDAEIERFRFDGMGTFHFQAVAGKKYRLKPLIADNWQFSIRPATPLKAGDRAEATFVQKQ